jgi:hypothetical protein
MKATWVIGADYAGSDDELKTEAELVLYKNLNQYVEVAVRRREMPPNRTVLVLDGGNLGSCPTRSSEPGPATSS